MNFLSGFARWSLAMFVFCWMLPSCSTDDGDLVNYVLIYNGRASDAAGVEQMAKAAQELGYPVEYISNLRNLPDRLSNASCFTIGGTTHDTGAILDQLEDTREELIDWVNGGGSYFGICGGAYIATAGSQWEDGYEDGIGLVEFESEEYDKSYDEAQIITVSWLNQERSVYYLNGPAFKISDLTGVTIFARYPDQRVAALVVNRGEGKVILCGPHPEADETWLIDDPEPRNAQQWKATWDMFLALMAEI